MPAKKDLARELTAQVKNLKVKSKEELTQDNKFELIKVAPTTPAITMSVPAQVQNTPNPLAMDTTEQTMEDLIDRLIATHMTGTPTSQGIPDMIYQVSCDIEATQGSL